MQQCGIMLVVLSVVSVSSLAGQQRVLRSRPVRRDSAQHDTTQRDTSRNALPRDADSTVTLRHDSVTVRFVDADIRAVVQALAPYLDRPVVFGNMSAAHVTLQSPTPIPRSEIITLLKGALESQNFELVADSGLYRVHET